MNIYTQHMKNKTITSVFSLVTLSLLAAQPIHAADNAAAESLAKGLEWLVSRQAESGSFSDPQYPGLSGLALWAIAASGDEQYKDAVKKGSDFILTKVQADGGIYSAIPNRPGGGLSVYNTAVALTALAATGRDDITKVVLDARSFLAGAQHLGDDSFKGGFGYDKTVSDRPYTDLMNTHFVIEAMRRTQHFEDKRPAGQTKADLNWDAAIAFAESLHNDADAGDSAGGFAYSPADAKAGLENASSTNAAPGKIILRSYGSITYAGLMSLVYCKIDKTDPRVQSALDWAARHWSLEENPGVGDQGLYFFYNVISRSMSVLGDTAIKRQDAPAIEWAKELAAKIVSLQRDDGSWVNKNGRFWENDPILSTAYSLLALEFATGKTK